MAELIYERVLRIRSEQVDCTRHLRISELFRLMEEASIAHTEALGCPRQMTLDRGLLWVITRQSAEIGELPRYDDEIFLRSWQGEMMHVFFPRFYELWKDNRRIVRGQALWMLIREDTRSMALPEDYGIRIPGVPDSPDIDLPAVRRPEGCGEPVLEERLVTRYSQVDINGHMNNIRYFDLVDDRGTEDLHGAGCPRKIRAEYTNELRLGEEYTLRGYAGGGLRYYEGTAGKPKFRILLEY